MIVRPQILALLALFLIMFSGPVRGDGGILATDKVAHFGLSYAIQTTGYGILKENGFDKVDSVILSALGTFALGVCWEAFGPTPPNKGDILANSLGQAAAITTILRFDF
jgi:hypothetical protein